MNEKQKKAIELIREKYLHEYKNIYGKESSIKFFNSILDIAKENDLENYALWVQGVLKNIEEKHDEAIKLLEKAVEKDKNFAFPWHGLGFANYNLKQFEKAIDHYNKAIAIDEKYAYPWNGLGNVYRELKQFEKAIDHYNKAIAIDEKHAPPWNGQGVIFSEQKEFDKAIESYDKAIVLEPNWAGPYFNKARTLEKQIKLEDALTSYKKAAELYEKSKNEYYLDICNRNIEKISNDIQVSKPEKKDEDDRAKQVIKKTQDIAKSIFENEKNFSDFIIEKDKDVKKDEEKDEIYLEVLRRFNSYTPIIAEDNHISKGGGYFIKINGKGIVIDPGFNFIDNFREQKHKFHEIDAVLITHAHNDHTSDLESILTLLYKYNDEISGPKDKPSVKAFAMGGKDSAIGDKELTIRDNIARNKDINRDEVSKDEIEKEFVKSGRRKTIDIYMSVGTFKKYSGMLDLFKKKEYTITIVEQGYEKDNICGAHVKVIGAHHRDIISDYKAVGFLIEAGETALIYTGDTAWTDELENEYRKSVLENEKYKNANHKHKLLLAHIGGVLEKENFYIEDDPEKKKGAFYDNHLGRLGLVKINELLKPEICFISEFGEEMKVERIELADIYNEIFDKKPLFFAADIGLRLDLNKWTMKAITKMNTKDIEFRNDIAPSEVETDLCHDALYYFKKGVNKLALNNFMSKRHGH